MKKRLAAGAAMLLTLGSAVAGSMMYAHDEAAARVEAAPLRSASVDVAPEVLAMWKANAASSDYIAPKVPI